MASRSALIVLFSLSMLGSLLATTVAADDVVLERSSASTAADASSSQGAVPSTPPVSDEVASDASSAVSSGIMDTLPSSPSVSPMSPADDVHSVASDEAVAESTSPAPTTVDADAPSRSSQAEVAEPIGNASSSTDASHVAGDVLTTATPETESPASVERVDNTNTTTSTIATTTPEEPLSNTTDAITTDASTAALADAPSTEAQLTTHVDESAVPLADEALPTTALPTSTDSEVTAQQTYDTTAVSTPTAPLETAPPAVVVVVASTSLQSATASPLHTEGSLSSTSLPPPPSTPPSPTTMAVPLTSGAPPTPSELEARQKAFCRHTTTSSSLRHPIVFGRRVTVSEFLLICKGFVKSPRFLKNLRPSQVSALSAAACGVLTATDVGLLGRTFGYVSEECIVSIPGASWRGATPSSIARLFSSVEGRRLFNLASNISGLTMESILEVERQSGCFSKAQCSSLLHRGQSYPPKVCGNFESPSEPATAGATSPPPTLPLDATVVQTQVLAERIKATPLVGGGGLSTTIVRPTLAAKKGEVGSGPQRLARGDASPSLVMPITAGVIAACLLFTWSHIRRRKPSR